MCNVRGKFNHKGFLYIRMFLNNVYYKFAYVILLNFFIIFIFYAIVSFKQFLQFNGDILSLDTKLIVRLFNFI